MHTSPPHSLLSAQEDGLGIVARYFPTLSRRRAADRHIATELGASGILVGTSPQCVQREHPVPISTLVSSRDPAEQHGGRARACNWQLGPAARVRSVHAVQRTPSSSGFY